MHPPRELQMNEFSCATGRNQGLRLSLITADRTAAGNIAMITGK